MCEFSKNALFIGIPFYVLRQELSSSLQPWFIYREVFSAIERGCRVIVKK